MSGFDLSPMQKEYWNNANRRWNVKTGATGSGKTFLDFYLIPKRIRACKGNGLIVFLGNTRSTLCRNILDPMREIYGERAITNVNNDNVAYLFGKKVYCLGADKVNQVSKIQGATIEYAYGDEVTTWNKEVFEMLKSRLRCPNSCFDGTCNPDNPNHWFKKFLDSDADIYKQKYIIDDNPFLPAKFVEELKKEYAGSVYYKRYILGEWAIAEGLVYGMFEREKNVFSGPFAYRDDSSYYLSIDYGTMNPFAVGLMELQRNGVVRMLKEGGYSGRESGKTIDNEAYYDIIKEVAGDYPITSIIIDPSAAGMKATIRKYGEFTCTDGDNDVLNGIQEVTKYINAGYLKIHDSCKGTLDEFEAYSWDDKVMDEDRVIKENDHRMDLIRYFIYTVARRYNRGII